MANVFQFTDWVTMESLRILQNKLEISQFFNTDYNKEFTKEFAVGETVRVKLPQRWLIRDGLGYSPQPINRLYTTVTCNQIFGLDFEWDSVEKALKMERGEEWFKREYIDPAMTQLAQEIDSRCALWAYLNTNNITGIIQTDPTTTAAFHQARQRLIENACPVGELGMIVAPHVMSTLASTADIQKIFNPSSEISQLFKMGSLGKLAGFDCYESMSLYTHTVGTWTITNAVYGSGQSGNSLICTLTAGNTIKAGDVFAVDGLYNVNPVTRRSTGSLKQFVITQDLTAAGGTGADIIYFQPAIIGPGSQYQNVSVLPTSGAVLVIMPGTTTPSGYVGTQNLALHRDAFALVGVKLELPQKVEVSSQTRDPESGISIRFVRMFDPIQSKMVNRFDILLGFGNLYPDNCAVRVQSA